MAVAGTISRGVPGRVRHPLRFRAETQYRAFAMRFRRLGIRKVGIIALLGAAATVLAVAPRAGAQTGSIQFEVRATPVSGVEEPVRGFPLFLLSKSFEDITKEAAAAYPPPDMGAFIDKLDASKELKAWMKKNRWVQLSGEDFLEKVKPADVVAVPEFYSAYLQSSSGAASLDFPKAKFKPVDKTKDPAKYERLSAEYHEAVEHYIEQNPQSKDGMDLSLVDQDPSAQWQALTAKRDPEIRRRAIELAQSRYFVARMQTDLQGLGSIGGIRAGTYWVSSLELSAQVGDAHPRWDVPVTVRAGQTAHVVLSNVNAIQAPASSF